MADSLQHVTDFRVRDPRVLLVEDSDIAARLIADQLREGWQGSYVRRVVSLADALHELSSEAWDVVLTDLGLPDSDGLATVQRIREQNRTVPIVVLTANNDADLAVEALEEHAQDFLVKRRMDPEILARTVRYAIGRQRIFARLQAVAAEATRSETNLHQLISRSADGIVVCDAEGIVLYANEAALPLLPCSDGLPIGERIPALPLDREHSEIEVHTRDTVLLVDVRVVEVDWEGQRAKMALLRDMSERRSAEELRLQLERSERLASVGQLAASVAHEINNPLAYVIANLELLQREVKRRAEASPEQGNRYVRHLEYALEGAQRVARIVADLGAFSRKDTVQLARPTDINETVRSALSMANAQLKHRAEVQTEFGNMPAAHGDSGRLCQVFLNLFVNAAHAMKEGHVQENSLRIRTYASEGRAIIEVRDSGGGIPAEIRERVFEPFFTTKKGGEGSGLGLYVCRNIVQSFGGDITLEPNEDHGTCARVWVPLWRRSELPPRPSPTAAAVANLHARVLVVDDEPFVLRSLEDMLREQHEVVLCSSGEEAKALLANDARFDVILCDVMMQNGTGPELLTWLRSHIPVLASRVVFMTGGGVGALSSVQGDEAVRVITKPFSLEDVLAQVATTAQEARLS
jgi:signal transduction histidine kinase